MVDKRDKYRKIAQGILAQAAEDALKGGDLGKEAWAYLQSQAAVDMAAHAQIDIHLLRRLLQLRLREGDV